MPASNLARAIEDRTGGASVETRQTSAGGDSMGSARLAESAMPRYARHETFAPRFGWMHKVYEAVSAPGGEDAFLRATAPVDLGVGKNMVNAMRFWAQAFDLTTESPQGGKSRALVAAPTDRARWLLDTEHGVDPWLEDPASLWILHWWLLSPTCWVPTWWVAFNALGSARFRDSDLIDLGRVPRIIGCGGRVAR